MSSINLIKGASDYSSYSTSDNLQINTFNGDDRRWNWIVVMLFRNISGIIITVIFIAIMVLPYIYWMKAQDSEVPIVNKIGFELSMILVAVLFMMISVMSILLVIQCLGCEYPYQDPRHDCMSWDCYHNIRCLCVRQDGRHDDGCDCDFDCDF